MKKGFSYYTIDTDRYQDRRIKRLKKDFGCNGLAVYDYLLCEIYRVQGCFLEWDEDTAFDVAEYFGLKESLVREIVKYCGAVGLFEKDVLSRGIITSASIQQRYSEMMARAKRKDIAIPDEYLLVGDSRKNENIREEMAEFRENSGRNGRISGSFSQNKIKEKKRNNLSLSYSLPLEVETEREEDGVTAVEKDRFFEIFFFRNFQHPDKEVERFIDFYSASGWRRHGDVRTVRDRQALARQWKPENPENGCNRFPSEFLNPFLGCFSAIRAQNASDAAKIIHGVVKVEISADKMRIICNDETRLLLERYIGIVQSENLTGGRALHYAVPRN